MAHQLQKLNKLAWDEFVARSPQGSVFASTGFLDCYQLDYDLWAVEENGSLVAGIAVPLVGGKPAPAPMPLGQYQQTILLAPPVPADPGHSITRKNFAAVEFLLNSLWQKNGRFGLFLHHSFPDIRPISWFHYHEPDQGVFEIKVYYTGLIELAEHSSFDEYLRSVRRTRRQEFEAAPRKGLKVTEETDLAMLIELYRETFDRQSLDVAEDTIGLLERITRFAFTRGLGKMRVCRDKTDRPIAATLFLHDNRCAYYLVGANHPDSRPLGAGPFLFLENIRRFHEEGYRNFDVVGINSPNRGDFKISFNAKPVPYYVCNCLPRAEAKKG